MLKTILSSFSANSTKEDDKSGIGIFKLGNTTIDIKFDNFQQYNTLLKMINRSIEQHVAYHINKAVNEVRECLKDIENDIQ